MNAGAPPAPLGRLQLVLLAILFFLPLLASYAVYFWFPDLRPTGTTNYGQLLHPAQPVPALQLVDSEGQATDETAFRGRWTYLVRVPTSGCESECQRALIMTRQVRLSLNEKRPRVQRILLARDAASAKQLSDELSGEHPDLHVLADEGPGALGKFLDQQPASVHLLDPLGNWLMTYPTLLPGEGGTQEDFKGMRKDIKKLLKISQIG